MSLLDRYHDALRARLTSERADRVAALVSGAAAPEVQLAALSCKAGYVQAIDDVMAAMDDVKTKLTGGE